MMERRLDFYILRITATFLQAILVVYQPSLKYLQANSRRLSVTYQLYHWLQILALTA